jgi:hypothetical protein
MTDEALHAVARLLLRLTSPQRAREILGHVGTFLPAHETRSDMLRAHARLQKRGTCLTRSLAVAARAPEVDLVIGITSGAGLGIRAHAWLELSGEPIDPSDVAGRELARIPSSRR